MTPGTRILLIGAALAALVAAAMPLVEKDAAAQGSLSIDPSAQAIATDIIEGTVIRTTTVETRPGDPHLVSEVLVTSTLKGSAFGTILVEVSGGASGDWIIVKDQQPALAPNDVVRLALVLAPGDETRTLRGGVRDTSARQVYSIVNGLSGTAWLSGQVRDQMEAFTAMASGDFAYYPSPSGAPRKWGSFANATYRINPANSGVATNSTISAVNAAIGTWENDPGSSVNYTYQGTTSLSGSSANLTNVVSWVTTPNAADSWIAQATWYISGSTHRISAFDVEFNRDFAWSTTAGGTPGRFDIQTTALHEFGHTLGLAHTNRDPAEIMYPSILSGSTQRNLGLGDTQGIRGLYPVQQKCAGRLVTVDLSIGQLPTNGNDVIIGTNNSDVINALGGDDIVCALNGVDIVNGGSGNDTLYGQSGPDTLNGQVGNDLVFGGQGRDTLVGGPGADILKGSSEDDRLFGGDGNDVLMGETGADLIYGQEGDDRVYGQDGPDQVHGDGGADVVVGGNGNDTVTGGPGNDELYGSNNADTMRGGAGHDTMSGGFGNDIMNGDDGDDVLSGDQGADSIVGGTGADDLRGGPDGDTIFGGFGPDLLRGAGGNDTLYGQAGNDVLFGQTGSDTLIGGDANDQLLGGDQFDNCQGGAGADSAGACEVTSSVP